MKFLLEKAGNTKYARQRKNASVCTLVCHHEALQSLRVMIAMQKEFSPRYCQYLPLPKSTYMFQSNRLAHV